MRDVVRLVVKDVIPGQKDSLALQGISATKIPSDSILKLYQDARELFTECCHPVGVIADITKNDFEGVYRGEGRNEPRTPVEDIFTKANRLALFAVTVGNEVHDKISELFSHKDFALGSMLDSVASAGVERATDLMEARYSIGKNRSGIDCTMATMRYSPGYCGWHVSGQKRLFGFLKPEDIGITLRDSFLMEPLKSVSGVFIDGCVEIHVIEDSYPFCDQCETHSCRDRVPRPSRLGDGGECGPHPSSTSLNEKE